MYKSPVSHTHSNSEQLNSTLKWCIKSSEQVRLLMLLKAIQSKTRSIRSLAWCSQHSILQKKKLYQLLHHAKTSPLSSKGLLLSRVCFSNRNSDRLHTKPTGTIITCSYDRVLYRICFTVLQQSLAIVGSYLLR